MEFALWPIVTPDVEKSTLGKILERLSKKGDEFALRLATSDKQTTSIGALVQMLRLMWPNPDRHGTGEPRTPEQAEAENVVHLAVLIVNWVRSGALAATLRAAASQS